MENAVIEPAAGFHNLGLSPASLAALEHVNYQTPSPIQAAFIPKAVAGGDCIGQARTGTGKTAAFVLPILERIDPDKPIVQAIVLTPTRELSEQVAVECRRLSYTRPVQTACCVGGKQIKRQIDALRQGAQIVIGTPGRVLDLISRKLLLLENIRVAVLDEADRMLDIGFRPDIEKILRRCPTDRQTLLLSATLPAPVERLAQRYMRSPVRVDLSKDQVAVDTVEQYYVTVDHDRKLRTLAQLLAQEIDVSSISHIINYDIPEYCADYVHRIGRTGRLAGEAGFAFTFVCRDEGEQLTNIEMRINKMLPQYKFVDFEPTRHPAPKPIAPPKPVAVVEEPVPEAEPEEEFAFAVGVA